MDTSIKLKEQKRIMRTNNNHVNYKISLYPSKSAGYQSKNKEKGEVKLYISSIWKAQFDPEDDFDTNFYWFLEEFLYTLLLERICLERGFQKIRMTDRCVPYGEYRCKMDYITDLMRGGFEDST